MKLERIKLKNFRGYQNEVSVDFDDLTVFVGKNDVGKSTILGFFVDFYGESSSFPQKNRMLTR